MASPAFASLAVASMGLASLAFASTAGAAALNVRGDSPNAQAAMDAATPQAVLPSFEELVARSYSMPEGTPRHTVYYDTATGKGGIPSGPTPEGFDNPVYVNEPPDDLVFPPGPGRLIADDIHTVAMGGCAVSGYEFRVGRSANRCSLTGAACDTVDDCSGTTQTCDPRPDAGFGVEFALYDGCPGLGGQIIPGTVGTITFVENGLFTVLVDFGGNNIPTASTVWLGVEFDKHGAGWVVGTPASTGFTENVYHHPVIPCVARFPGSVLYAGYHARMFCSATPPFEREFLAYFNPELNGTPFVPGGGQWIADDVTLIVEDCIMTSYEIGSTGGAPYTVTAEIWRICDEATVVAGTHGVFQGIGGGTPELARFSFPEGIQLNNGANYWVAWKYSNNAAAIIAEDPALGESDNLFGLPGIGCGFWFGPNGPIASFSVTIRCLGEPPVGACCRRAADNDCTITDGLGCTQPGDEWRARTSCDPDPFDAPCGTLACCLPGPAPQGGCQNLSPEECAVLGGIVDGSQTCGASGQDCASVACREATGECCAPNGALGCDRSACCNAVCDTDPWCCEFEWDLTCAGIARNICSVSCPGGAVQLLDPPADVVDARQPSAIGDASQRQGIDSIHLIAPSGSGLCCWSLCETGFPDSVNYIAAVTPNDDDTMTLDLARPITPGRVTTLTYTSTGQSFSLTAHPGNVNGDDVAAPSDILALIDGLNGAQTLPWGVYSCDLDHSGVCGPEDILRTIDLLNGAGVFSPWIDTALPTDICP